MLGATDLEAVLGARSVPVIFSFPGSAWECVNWRLRLHYHGEPK